MEAVEQYLNSIGYQCNNDDMQQLIDEWQTWYEGKVEEFHSYNIYNGNNYVQCERLSLQIAKKVCEDKADLLLNEKVTINISDEATQEFVNKVLYLNNFYVCSNNLLELANALGTGAFVEYIDNGNILIDYIDARNIYPLSVNNKNIIECAFASCKLINCETYIYLNIHTLESDGYVITNKLFKQSTDCKDDGGLMEVDLPQGVAGEYRTGSFIPLFQIIKPNIVNNFNTNSALGMSCFGNSIDIIKSIDLIYDSYINEFSLGKKRIFIDSNMVNVSISDGEIKPTFDTNDSVFYGINMDESKNSILEIDMNLRTNEHSQALNDALSVLSQKVGLGYGYYNFDKTGVKTATEVISENSQLYRNVKKDELILAKALTDMTIAIIFLGSQLGESLDIESEITINFDDSIIEDSTEIRRNAILEYQNGLIDAVEYYKIVYKMTDEQAKKHVEEIKSRQPEETQLVQGVY